MNLLKAAIPLCVATLVGCSGIQKIPEAETNSLISAIIAPAPAPAPATKERAFDWVQPQNKKEACLIIFGTTDGDRWWEAPNTTILWDGECRDGYAYGLGREFVDGSLGLMATISEYKGGRTKPTEHAVSLFDNAIYSSLSGKNKVGYKHNDIVPEESEFFIDHVAADGTTAAIIKKLNKSAVNYKSFPSGYKVIHQISGNPASQASEVISVSKDGEPARFGIIFYRNNAIQHFRDINVAGKHELPASYLQFLMSQSAEIIKRTELTKASIDASEIAVKRYRRSACADDVKFEGISESIYKRICQEQGDLSIHTDAIEQAVAKVNKEHEYALRSQAETAARIAAQNAANRNQSISDMTNQLNNISNTLQQNNNSMYQYNMQNINNMQSQPQFQMNQPIQTNCIEAGNIINCRTR